MSYTRLKNDAPSRGINDISQGDFIKVGSSWKEVESSTGFQKDGHWTVRTKDGRSHSGWGINRYAKAEDLEDT